MTRYPAVSTITSWLLLIILILALGAVPAGAQEITSESAETPAAAEAPPEEQEPNVLERFDSWVGEAVVSRMAPILFFPVYESYVPYVDGNYYRTEDGEYIALQKGLFNGTPDGTFVQDPDGVFVLTEDGEAVDRETVDRHSPHKKAEFPLIVLVLAVGGLFFTFRYGFINVRLFKHSIDVIRGRYDRPDDTGEVSHFRALTSALSATVGLGNIAGVAVAISLGGAGAVFWMWLTAFFGMSMKFSSCTFAHLYRRVQPDGHILGGPMVYLEQGIADRVGSAAVLGKVLAYLFAVLTVFAAFGGGNMFQGNQTASIIAMQFFDGSDSPALRIGLGVFLAVAVGMVLIGGIRRIGEVTARMIPAMCVFYCSICAVILLINFQQIPGLFVSIFANAFNADALFGGFVGVLVQGMRRAAFSNEAGLGSAAIAHATAKTDEPVREGVVAMIGPFIDTIVVCSMTALTILVTGAHLEGGEGVQITANAFAQLGGFAPIALCLAVFVFAYSTMIAWGYYGERAVEYLFGERGIKPYRVVYVLVVILGPMLSLGSVIDFSDMMLLSMAFPNIIGMILISGKVREMTKDYVRRLQSGEMKPLR